MYIQNLIIEVPFECSSTSLLGKVEIIKKEFLDRQLHLYDSNKTDHNQSIQKKVKK